MIWVHKFVWWLTTMATCSGNRIINQSTPWNYVFLWDQLGDLMKSCFLDQTNSFVITENMADSFHKTSQDVGHLDVSIINHDYRPKNIKILKRSYPIHILSPKSADNLEALLLSLKSSSEWRISSVFFIVDFTENSCEKSSKMMQVLWKLDLTSSFYVCYEPDKEVMMLYIYNPFTNRAPAPWVEVEFADKPNDKWTLYKQPYSNDTTYCDSLIFDKTQFLDGYNIKAVSRSLSTYTRNKAYDINTLQDHVKLPSQVTFSKNLFLHLNATPTIHYDVPTFWINNTAVGTLKSLIDGTHDICLNWRSSFYFMEYVDSVKMHQQFNFMILTQRKNLETKIDNFRNFLNSKIIGASIFIMLVTFIIMAFNKDHDYGDGFLDMIRLFLSAGIMVPLNRLSMRIIFLTATLFVFLMSPALLGQVFSLLAKPKYHYPQTLEDLHDFKFNVYYHLYLKDFIDIQNLWLDDDRKYLHPFSHHPSTCHEQVSNDSSNACIAFTFYQISAAKEYNLHLAKKKICNDYGSYWIRKNWALKDKVDMIVSRFEESGLHNLWVKKDIPDIPRNSQTDSPTEFEKVEFEDLKIVFIFLAIGLGFGFLIFVVEIVIGKYKS